MIKFDFDLGLALQLLEEVKKYRKDVTEDDFKYVRCVCGKKLPVETLGTIWTGHVRVIKNLCEDCLQNARSAALIVCNGCKSVEGFVTPQTDKDGFKIEKGKIYHQMACPNCRPNLLKTTFVEKAVFDFHRKSVSMPMRLWLESYNEYKNKSELYA